MGGASDIINGGPSIIGMEADENKHLIDRLIKKKMKDHCSLNLVPVHKMASMIDKYVSSNEAHGLETFFDHEVFRKSYHEVRRKMLDSNKSFAITSEFETQLRDQVRTYLNYTFGSTADDEDGLDDGSNQVMDSS